MVGVVVATWGLAEAECLKPVAADKQVRANKVLNQKRLAAALAKRGLKRIKLAKAKQPHPDTHDGPASGTVINGVLWFKLMGPPCGGWFPTVELAQDKRGNIYRLAIEAQVSERPRPEVCECPPPGPAPDSMNECGLGGLVSRYEGYVLPARARFKGDIEISYVQEPEEVLYSGGLDCLGGALPPPPPGGPRS
jgi:hypothetical protein